MRRRPYDIDTHGTPKFVTFDYIDLNQIDRISTFRSAASHDYSDDSETCRSMKHYYAPKAGVDWSTVDIYSPANGTVDRVIAEWAGYQVHVTSQDYPAFVFILFHVNLNPMRSPGDTVTLGQHFGTHISSLTPSDIAIRVATPDGAKLVSFFSVMTDSLFLGYQGRGVATRDDATISAAAQNADSLDCSDEAFGTSGTLTNWVLLN